MIQFFVPGIAATSGSKTGFVIKSKKTGKNRVIMAPANKKQKPWMAHVRAVAVENYPGPPLSGAVKVSFGFFLPRPKGHFGSGKNADKLKTSAPDYPTTKPDLTKLVRAAEDALVGIIWKDDSQVVLNRCGKEYCDDTEPTPGVYITIDAL